MLDLRSASTLVRVTLVIVFFAFGYVKFFPFEAEGMAPLIDAHPLLNWMVPFGPEFGSRFLGIFEIATGLLLAARPWSPRVSALGGLLGRATFFTTLALFFFLPGVGRPRRADSPSSRALAGSFSKTRSCSPLPICAS